MSKTSSPAAPRLAADRSPAPKIPIDEDMIVGQQDLLSQVRLRLFLEALIRLDRNYPDTGDGNSTQNTERTGTKAP